MWWIADDGGVEQSDGSFLQRRTHTLDPQPSFDPAHLRRRVPRYNGHSSSHLRPQVFSQFDIAIIYDGKFSTLGRASKAV